MNPSTKAVFVALALQTIVGPQFLPARGKAEAAATPVAGAFTLTSPAVENGGALPVEFTGDGESATLPLAWSGEPAGTRSFVVIMHHVDAQDVAKWYWTLYDIPSDIHALAKDVQSVGTLGTNSVNNRVGYAPPHSAGAGPRTYVYTLYALSTFLALSVPPEQVTLAVLLDAMKGHVLGTAEICVVSTRSGNGEEGKGSISPAPPPR